MTSMTNQQLERGIVGGVDTHKLTHHAAALDAATGQLLGDHEFPATGVGYEQMLTWLLTFGAVLKVGVEGTGSFGAGLQRHLEQHRITVFEVSRPNRQDRRTRGKSDPINAARAVLSEAVATVPKAREGFVEPSGLSAPPGAAPLGRVVSPSNRSTGCFGERLTSSVHNWPATTGPRWYRVAPSSACPPGR